MEQEGQPQPTTPQETPQEALPHVTHTYATDLAHAMDATDATVIQEIMKEGKEREEQELQDVLVGKQRVWYKTGAIILILCTLAAGSYSIYHYIRLTVPAEKAVSVGVFPSTSAITSKTTTIQKVLETLATEPSLDDGKPYLVPLVTDETSLTLLSNSELFSFFGAKASEPFLTAFTILRYGVLKKNGALIPFIIGSTKDTDISTKELLIAEPDLLDMLHLPLGIDITAHTPEIGKEFVGAYMFNIPVRTLQYDTDIAKGNLLLLYGRVAQDIVVFTTSPIALKAIYESLIAQH